MAAIISSAFVLSPAVQVDVGNLGIIGSDNVVTFDSISATSELATNPITNAANPATSFTWIASSDADQTITIASDGQEVDYVGIARHNLNQFGAEIRIQFDGQTVIDWSPVADSQSLLYLVNKAAPTSITIGIRDVTTSAKVAVIYVGKAIRLQRGIYVGHTPITYGRNRTTVNGVSENGQYLGEIVTRETSSTNVDLKNLTAAWYRETLDPFFAEKPRRPCFWAWRPKDYPAEVGFCWVEGNPQPSNQRSNGMMQIGWAFKGIA